MLACKDGRGSEGACVAGLVQKWSKVACGSILAQGRAWFARGRAWFDPRHGLRQDPKEGEWGAAAVQAWLEKSRIGIWPAKATRVARPARLARELVDLARGLMRW